MVSPVPVDGALSKSGGDGEWDMHCVPGQSMGRKQLNTK